MAKGERAGDSPLGVDVIEGKTYYWCACGKSKSKPFVMDRIREQVSNHWFIKQIKLKKFFLHV